MSRIQGNTDNRKALTWEVESLPRYPHLTPCWNVTSHKPSNDQGYPMMSRYRKPVKIYRLVYDEMFGPNPKGIVIRHKCDNKLCINPEHLTSGTQAENIRDAQERNRTRGIGGRGQNNVNAKLTNEQARKIRALCEKGGQTQVEIAKMFGVCASTVSLISTGSKWKTV